MATVIAEAGISEASRQVEKIPLVLGTAQSEAEFEAYRAVLAARQPSDTIAKSAEFLKQYHKSGLSPFVRQAALFACEQLNQWEQVIAHGEAVLQELPESPLVLALTARAYAETGQPEKTIERALQALNSLSRMERPPGADEARWRSEVDRSRALVHLSMGTAYLRQAQESNREPGPHDVLERALASLESALRVDPENPLVSYRLASAVVLRRDLNRAAMYYAYTVVLGGSLGPVAKRKLEQLAKGQATEIDRVMSEARDEIRRRIAARREATRVTVP
ncbi:MAG: hypothetical protein ACKV22_28090 [Bryobacteraceae bacterium]